MDQLGDAITTHIWSSVRPSITCSNICPW